jgi:hypothetical protein
VKDVVRNCCKQAITLIEPQRALSSAYSRALTALRENRSGIIPGRMNRIMNALVTASGSKI